MINFIQRINNIISANINDLIDHAEEPEIMLNHIIREMEENIRFIKQNVIHAIAGEKRLGRESEYHSRQSEYLLKKAEIALKADNEKLARAALTRKKEHDKIVQELEEAWKSAKISSRKLKDQLHLMEHKLEKARIRCSSLTARKRAAETRQQMGITLSRFQKSLCTEGKFSRIEDKILEIETCTEAIEELNKDSYDMERELEKLEADTEVENELEALKDRISK